jgi:murein DD-endopeptidase MepM/ murein hydrolase activator NlpD
MLTIFLNILLSIFTPPVDYDISLAGNFGEPRPHHFHGGLDIRTDGVEGKHIYAIGDGYVSRVTAGLYGFGNAVYITHPTGHTSIYCHLKSFSPRIKAAMRKYQYKHQTCVADVKLTPLDVPVSQGQFIALSGNTGNSMAPHLHLEVHDTKSWNMLDPYQFLNEFIADSVAPQAHGFMAIPLGGTFNGSADKQVFSRGGRLTACGPVGFALWADDYMQGSYNHYGISETLLYVDGQVTFHSVVDNIPTQLNRMVNSWGDYDYWLHHRRWYMKSYIEPGNTLACLHADENRGVIKFDEERDYQLEYVLRDFKGNEARYPFTVSGVPAQLPEPPRPTSSAVRLRWNRTNSYSRPGLQLVVPYGFLAADAIIRPRLRRQPQAWSDACQLSEFSLPLMTAAELSIHVNRTVTNSVVDDFDPAKLYITNENGAYMGGSYHDGWVTGQIRELAGCYEVAYDDQPPRVSPIAVSGSRLLLNVIDSESGIATWTATVDGRFIVFDDLEKSSFFACELHESWLQKSGRQHHLHFEVTDNRRNTRVYETTFTY